MTSRKAKYLFLIILLVCISFQAGGARCEERTGNRLRFEVSPYLLKHATNPVDWYPWGEEALALAQEKDKPIFLSIGYLTCHWCNRQVRNHCRELFHYLHMNHNRK